MSKRVKAVKATIKLLIPAGQAKPAPPVGPALGQAGLNIMSFCKDFNAKTAELKADVPVPVRITAYQDKSYEWEMRTPPTTYFIKQALGIKMGSERPGHAGVGTIGLKQVYAIAELKATDSRWVPLKGVVKSVISTARSMGVQVVDDREQQQQQQQVAGDS